MAGISTSERMESGPSGPFPMRFPIGMTTAIVVGLLLLPVWWKLGLALAPKLQAFYLWTYFGTEFDSLAPTRAGVPAQKRYVAMVDGTNLAVEKALDEHPDRMRVQTISASPAAFHRWLRTSVYFGSATRVLKFPLAFATCAFGALLIGGAEVDRRRRANARKGLHIRGTRLVNWRRFNRESLGKRLLPGFSVRNGHLHFGGCSKLTPGMTFRIGRFGQQIVLPRELEPYHFNIFG